MATGKLTDAKIKALKPTGKRYKLADGDGLYLEVTETGSKSFRMRIQTGGKDSTVTLGKYPYLSLAEARLKRNDLLRQIADGIDPRQEKKKAAVPTFREVTEEWIARNEASWRKTYTVPMRQRLELDVYPAFGSTPINQVTPQTVLDVLRKVESRGSISTAYKLISHIQMVFRYALSSLIIHSDPIASLDRDIVLTKYQRKHYAAATTKEDAAFVIRAVRNYQGTRIVKLALEFLMLTFVRPGNVRLARWEQIDTASRIWTIPAGEMKMDREHKVPLSRQAIAVLEQARLWQMDGNPLIFPSAYRRHDSKISSTTLGFALRCMGVPADMMSPHGFRSMASTLLNEAGYYPDVIETQLAHSSGNVRAIYNRSEYWDDRVQLMQAWADMCDELAKDVTPAD